MEEKKNILTREGLKRYEDELHELKVVRRIMNLRLSEEKK